MVFLLYMEYIERYQYQELTQITKDTGRVYVDSNGNKMPSVTTILSKTSDKSHIDEWRKRVGDEQADFITKLSSDVGSAMHENLENWIKGIPLPKGSAEVRRTGRELAKVIINKGLVHVDEVWGMEKHLYYPELYAGTADLLGVWKSKPAIMDFKNTRKPKKKEWITDYFKQLCAYGDAHNRLYGTDIQTGVIFMVSREPSHYGEYQEFEVNLADYRNDWWDAVSSYYNV